MSRSKDVGRNWWTLILVRFVRGRFKRNDACGQVLLVIALMDFGQSSFFSRRPYWKTAGEKLDVMLRKRINPVFTEQKRTTNWTTYGFKMIRDVDDWGFVWLRWVIDVIEVDNHCVIFLRNDGKIIHAFLFGRVAADVKKVWHNLIWTPPVQRLISQYFPKGTDISGFRQAKLGAVARQLNERPRKTLQYQPQAENLKPVLQRPVEIAGRSDLSLRLRLSLLLRRTVRVIWYSLVFVSSLSLSVRQILTSNYFMDLTSNWSII